MCYVHRMNQRPLLCSFCLKIQSRSQERLTVSALVVYSLFSTASVCANSSPMHFRSTFFKSNYTALYTISGNNKYAVSYLEKILLRIDPPENSVIQPNQTKWNNKENDNQGVDEI